ncbi:hypothetical protein FOCC_FOCC014220, partial [Frankliniella occidentalis]
MPAPEPLPHGPRTTLSERGLVPCEVVAAGVLLVRVPRRLHRLPLRDQARERLRLVAMPARRHLPAVLAARIHLQLRPRLRRCMCDPGYTGKDCESAYIPCSPSPCQNGGTCKQLDSLSYVCACPKGFRGPNCEENVDDCPGHLCQHGGECVDGVNGYTCRCPAAYTGERCEQDVDECSLRPSVCHNGATCTNTAGSFSCICVNGWTGPDCSVNIDDCAGAACFNGATCIDRVGSFYCRCTPGKTGLLCHLDDACTSNPCHADAICDTSPINGSYTCSCASGYRGVDCSEDINECEQGESELTR